MNTDQLNQFVDQVQRLWQTHVPPEYQVPVLPVAVGMLLFGVGVSVLGAKLARFGITCGFAGVGVLVALALAPAIGVSTVAALVVGVLLAGGIGYALFRLWVGLAAAVFFSAVALGVYGSQVVAPHFIAYDPAATFNGTFSLPDPSADDTTAERALSDMRAWADDFWLYVQSREADVNRRILGIGLGAALVGLLLGMMLPRLILIVASSVVGTLMVMSGLAGLAARSRIDLPQAAGQHGRVVAVAGLVFLLASLLLQTLLTRKTPPRAALPAE
ncbi:MAG: hypothetical protein V2A79_15770 [Planctomycetota bacterium]